jgi:hypothetical protein
MKSSVKVLMESTRTKERKSLVKTLPVIGTGIRD